MALYVRDLWNLRVAGQATRPAPRSRQRHQQRQSLGQPAVAMSELPLADRYVLQSPTGGSLARIRAARALLVLYVSPTASVAELVDAARLGRAGLMPLGVRVPPL